MIVGQRTKDVLVEKVDLRRKLLLERNRKRGCKVKIVLRSRDEIHFQVSTQFLDWIRTFLLLFLGAKRALSHPEVSIMRVVTQFKHAISFLHLQDSASVTRFSNILDA